MIIRREDPRLFMSGRRRRGPLRSVLLLALMGALGVWWWSQQNPAQVEIMVLTALNRPPQPTPFAAEWATQGAQAFVGGDLVAALRHYERAIAQQPNNVAYLYEYGKVLIESDRSGDASTVADRAIAADPNDVRGYALKANSIAYSDPTTAIIFALQGEELDPDYAPLYAAQAIANTQIFRFSQALASGERAIELNPNDPIGYRAYAWPLIFVGRSSEAVEMLEQAIAINPNLPGPYFQLAFEYKSRLSQPAMAIAIYQTILSNLNPSPSDAAKANLRICETYSTAEEARFDLAEPFCRRAITILPDYAPAWRELGRMQYLRRNYEGSIETFNRCVSLGSNEVDCWMYRGLAHYWLAQCDDAWRVLNEAMAMAGEQGLASAVVTQIQIGIDNTKANCPDYRDAVPPTLPPPTLIPPTPIGGL
jgi:tetratricopeptide (TPR) repeat protein